MAAPTVVARGSARTTTSNVTSHAITIPTHQAGDLIFVHFAVDGNPTVTVNGGSSSSGWSAVSQASNSTTVTGAWLYLIADAAGETLTLTTSASEQSSHTVLIIRPDTATSSYLSLAIEGTSANGSSTNSNPPSHAITRGYGENLFITTRAGDSTVVATVAPSSYGNLQTLAAAGTAGASTNTAEYTLTTTGPHDPGTFTSNSEQWVSWTICVRHTRVSPSSILIIDTDTASFPTDVIHDITSTTLQVFSGEIILAIIGTADDALVITSASSNWIKLNNNIFAWEVHTEGFIDLTVDYDAGGTSDTCIYTLFHIIPGSGRRLRLENIVFAGSLAAPASNHDHPSIALPGSLEFCSMIAVNNIASTSVCSAAPSGYTGLATDTETGSSLSSAYKNSITASSENPSTWTNSSFAAYLFSAAIWEDDGASNNSYGAFFEFLNHTLN